MSVPAIHIIGNVNVDLIMGDQAPWPTPGTEVMLPHTEIRIGGSAGNSALALRELGVPFRLYGNCGRDVLGEWLQRELGAAPDSWARLPTTTTISVGLTHPGGERTFFTSRGHLADLALEHILPLLPPRARPGDIALLVGAFLSPRLQGEYAALIGTLKARGFAIALDTGWPNGGWNDALRARVVGWLAQVDFLLLNEIETAGLAGSERARDGVRALARHAPAAAILVVKRGREGAEAWQGERHAMEPAPEVEVIDTVGAGDAFNAGFLAAALGGSDLTACLADGVALASHAIATFPRRYAPPRTSGRAAGAHGN